MRVVLDDGTSVDLGTTEATPSIGITDYSRRVTDDFGVTTVVERGFSRRMSVKLGLPFDRVDALQRRLAGLRATSALWVADERFASLTVRGFYKDFDIDLAVPPLSYCTLTVEGLAETTSPADAGGDPAPDGAASTLRLLQPVIMTNSVLVASNVAENDAPEWQGGTSYSLGARVVKSATHRVYESVTAANAGNDPAGISGKWLDVGPTNHWAMFDEALGTATTAAGAIVVTLDAGTIGAVALLDVSATTVRVKANGYDRTQPAGAGAITFLDLPGNAGQVTATISGSGTVSVGTLLIGRVVSLGITEASPTAGITDFSKKVVDDFGGVAIVERAWAKRMSAKALIRTDTLDLVANRIATVRARPSLWIGKAGVDSLTVYGFFKDFSIEVGTNVSKLSLSIEGLSKAPPPAALPTPPIIAWPDIADSDGTKPADNADVTGDNTSKDTNAVGGTPSTQIKSDLNLNGRNWFDMAQLEAGRDAQMLARTTLNGKPIGTVVTQYHGEFMDGMTAIAETFSLIGAKSGDGQSWILDQSSVMVGPAGGGTGPVQSLAQRFQSISASIGANSGSISNLQTVLVSPSGAVTAKAVFALNVNGQVSGIVQTSTGAVSTIDLLFSAYNFRTPSGSSIFSYSDPANGGDGKVYLPDVVVRSIAVSAVGTAQIGTTAIRQGYAVEMSGNVDLPGLTGQRTRFLSLTVAKQLDASSLRVSYNMRPRPGRDYASTFVLGRNSGNGDVDMDAQQFWLPSVVINNLRSLRIPINLGRTFEGLPAGQHTIYVDVVAVGGGNDQGFMEAGSNLYVEEVKR